MEEDDIEPRGSYARALELMTEALLTESDSARVLEALARITCETLGADRSLIYEVRLEAQLAVALVEWLNPRADVTPTKATYPLGAFGRSEEVVRTTRQWLESHAEAPHEAFVEGGSAELLHQRMAIQSLLWFPFDFHEGGYHLLVFNQVTHRRTWTPRELEFLRVATRHADLALMQIALKAEQAESQRALAEAQRAESIALLAGGVAHDFNNLLGIVIGAVGRARATLGPETPIASNLRDAERAAKEASELAKHLLAYAGKGQFVVETLDLAALVVEMQDLLRAATSCVALEVVCQGPCPVRGDASQLRQVVMNFVVNAAEAIDDTATGRIAVDVHVDGGSGVDGSRVVLEVRDNGRGMSEEVKARIFEPFFTTKNLGRGLGLAAVSGIVRSHGGELRVRSEVGIGTTLSVSFPAVEMRPAQAMLPSPPSTPSGGTVLLVDDSDNFRRMCACILGDLGFRTVEASGGAAAVEILAQHDRDGSFAIDVVLLDWTMPSPGGAETFYRLRASRPALPIVIMSGWAERTASEALRENATAFIEKPFTAETLEHALRAVLQGASAGPTIAAQRSSAHPPNASPAAASED